MQTEKQIEKAYFACSKESAFSMAAKEYRSQTQLKSTLKAIFEDKDGYAERMEALDHAYKKHVHRFMQPEYAKQLFQNPMSVSATQIE